MFGMTAKQSSLDRAAIWLSGLCLVHCLATAVIVTMLASAGGALVHPAIHEIGLMLAMGLAALSLGRGVREHGYAIPLWVGSLGLGVMGGSLTLPHGGPEIVYSMIGVLLVALGHDLNRRAARG